MEPTPIYFCGASLKTALGDNVPQHLVNLAKAPQHLSQLSVMLSDERLQIPYFLVKHPGRDTGPQRLRSIIDEVVAAAIRDAGLSETQVTKLGVFVGSTSFDIYGSEEKIRHAPEITDEVISSSLTTFGCLANYIRQSFSIDGPDFTFNTACTASANALMYAADMLRCGELEHALVVGLECSNDVTSLGFHSLELVSQKGMRPFDSQRDGLYLGEGCGAVILSREKPNAEAFCFVAGSNIGDTHSITSTEPEGTTIAKVINQALSQAGISHADIRIVKAHGTASLSNDEAEAAGLRRCFGDCLPPIQVFKPMIGHTLGACGVNELILFCAMISAKQSFPYCEPSSFESDLGVTMLTSMEGREQGYYLLNYFGFGGNNTALVISNSL